MSERELQRIDVLSKVVERRMSIEKVSHVPCAVAHGVVEIWPLKETT